MLAFIEANVSINDGLMVRVETGADNDLRKYLDTGITRSLADRIEFNDSCRFGAFAGSSLYSTSLDSNSDGIVEVMPYLKTTDSRMDSLLDSLNIQLTQADLDGDSNITQNDVNLLLASTNSEDQKWGSAILNILDANKSNTIDASENISSSSGTIDKGLAIRTYLINQVVL